MCQECRLAVGSITNIVVLGLDPNINYIGSPISYPRHTLGTFRIRGKQGRSGKGNLNGEATISFPLATITEPWPFWSSLAQGSPYYYTGHTTPRGNFPQSRPFFAYTESIIASFEYQFGRSDRARDIHLLSTDFRNPAVKTRAEGVLGTTSRDLDLVATDCTLVLLSSVIRRDIYKAGFEYFTDNSILVGNLKAWD